MKRRKLNQQGIGGALIALIIIIILAAAAAAWYFSTSGNGNKTATVTAPNGQPAAEQRIRDNWVKFFNGQTPAATKLNLLQNGQQYSQYVQAQSKSATAQNTTATVTKIQLTSNTTATVTYTIYVKGQAALQDQTGQAILISNIWKVSDTAFCQLLQLSGSAPANCPNAPAGSQTPSSSGTSGNATTNAGNNSSTTNSATGGGSTTTNGSTPGTTGTTPTTPGQ